MVVALANHFLTKRKTSAEIDKLNADTELTKAQARQITNSLNDLSDKVGYKLPDELIVLKPSSTPALIPIALISVS